MASWTTQQCEKRNRKVEGQEQKKGEKHIREGKKNGGLGEKGERKMKT